MKKLSAKQKAYQVRRSGSHAKRRRRRKEIKNFRREQFEENFKKFAPLVIASPMTPSGYVPVHLPAHMSISENFEETMGAINLIRELVLENGVPAYIHMESVERMGAGAAVVLCSEAYRCRNLLARFSGSRAVSGSYNKVPLVSDMLRQMGFYRMIGVSDIPQPERNLEERYFSRLVTFKDKVDAASIARFRGEVTTAFRGLEKNVHQRMQGGIIEAINNTVEHAYRFNTQIRSMSNRSWVSSIVNPARSEFTLNVFDQGNGIPSTLDRNLLETLEALSNLGNRQDSQLIEAAMSLHRTSTRQSGRGKGFMTMKRLVDSCADGELRVYSNRGRHTYNGSDLSTPLDFDQNLGGTLIQWRLRSAC